MRWAAGVLIGIWACGGSSHVNTSNPDGGGGNTTPSDAGSPADAGPTDAGPADAGYAAECIGMVPTSTGAALTFTVPYGVTCTAATSDGTGFLAAESHDGGSELTWNLYDTNGQWQGNFHGGALPPPPARLHGD